jgi:hypothetical protein
MKRRDFDIDHIDPRWEDGRDYQLVCGLDCPLNYREEEPGKNSAKSNRFLPWRWSRDEIGVVPEDYGDLAQFLVNGEWVLIEFLSEEWFQASWETCSLYHSHCRLQEWARNNPDEHRESSRKGGLKTGPENYRHLQEYYEQNPEQRREYALKGAAKTKLLFESNPEEARRRGALGQKGVAEWRKENPDLLTKNCSAAGIASGKVRFRCTVTGFISCAGPLTCYQKKRGIDPSNRIRLQ